VTQVHLNKKTSTLSLIPQGGLCAARELCKCHSKAGSGAAHTSTHQRTPAHVSPLPPHVSPLSTYVITVLPAPSSLLADKTLSDMDTERALGGWVPGDWAPRCGKAVPGKGPNKATRKK